MTFSSAINQSIIRASAAVICLFGTLAPAMAQSQQTQAPGGVLSGPAPTVDLDFRGGSAVEYISALRKAVGDAVNIIVMEHVGEVPIPQITLRSADFGSALGLLQNESFEDDTHRVEIQAFEIPPGMVGSTSGVSQSARKVYKVSARVKQLGPRRDETRSQIWSVADLLLGGFSADEISTAINSALDLMLTGSEPADVRFHEETGLIMARGRYDEIDLIDQVLAEMRVAASQRQSREQHSAQAELERVARDADAARMAKEQASDALTQAMRELEVVRARSEVIQEQMVSSTAQTREFRAQIDERDRMIAELKIQIDQLRRELVKAQDEARKP